MSRFDVNKSRQTNNFDFLRFISALFVIISHSYDLTGRENEELLLAISGGTYHFSSLGLICFFVTSGYLVSQSLFSSSSILNYAWKRILRILPALCAVVLFSVFVIGPIFGSLPLREYFLSTHTYSYLRNILCVLPMQWSLPGVFISNVDPSVNGSLWTLILEGRLYILLPLLYILRFFKRKYLATAVFVGLVIFSPWIYLLGKFYPIGFYLALFFMAGVVAALNKKSIKYNKWLFIAALSIIVLRCFYEFVNPLTFIAFPYMIFYLAQLRGALNRFGRYGDFSYGMFLYSFPLQQCIVQLAGRGISISLMILLSVVLALLFGVLSWKFIEARALKYKGLVK
jgi:peptidoglycan/LPS O-acetylase OafA/YrhL